MIPKDKWAQYGREGMVVQGITLHNTNNDYSARENAEFMMNSTSEAGCHFFIDEKETIQMMPEDWSVWHTGMGYDFGNLSTIAIEICRSTCSEELYKQAQTRAIRKIKNLMKKYELTTDNVYFHRSFNQKTYCPARILQIYGTRAKFIEEELS